MLKFMSKQAPSRIPALALLALIAGAALSWPMVWFNAAMLGSIFHPNSSSDAYAVEAYGLSMVFNLPVTAASVILVNAPLLLIPRPRPLRMVLGYYGFGVCAAFVAAGIAIIYVNDLKNQGYQSYTYRPLLGMINMVIGMAYQNYRPELGWRLMTAGLCLSAVEMLAVPDVFGLDFVRRGDRASK